MTPQDFEQVYYRIRHELGRLQYEVDSVLFVQLDSWNELRKLPSTTTVPNSAVPAVTMPDGMGATLDLAIIPSPFRDDFHAIVRVRTTAMRQIDKPVQRLGGSPNRGAPITQARPAELFRATGADTAVAASEILQRIMREEKSQETPIQDIAIEKESLWVQPASGDHVVVLDIHLAQDGTDVISFRRTTSDAVDPAVMMTKRDFLIHHRLYVPSKSSVEPPKPILEISMDQEWECQDGSAMVVTEVDYRKEMIFGDDLTTRKRRQIPFSQFALGRWRRIVRQSVYDRLRQTFDPSDDGPTEATK